MTLRSAAVITIGLVLLACGQPPGPQTSERPQTTPTPEQPAAIRPKPVNAGYPAIVGSVDEPATSFGAAVSGKHVYTLGGYTGNPHEYSREFQSRRFARLDLETRKWEELPSPGAIQSGTLSEYQGKLIRVGGMRIANAADEPIRLASVANVEIYDPKTSTWTAATPLPEPRSSHAAVIVGQTLYVIGGWTLDGPMGSGTYANHMFAADLTMPQLEWARLPVPFESRALGAASSDRFIVTVGGMAGRKVLRDVHLFDTVTRSWTNGPDLPEPGFGVAVANQAGAILASAPSGRVYSLDASAQSWNIYAELVFPRFFHSAVATQDALLVLGGIPSNSGGDRLRHIEQITPRPERFTSFLLNNPTGAKNRQGMFLVGNSLVLFGGNKALGQHDFAPANFLQSTHELDLGSFEWTELTPFPRASQSMQTLVTSKDTGLSVGGFGPDGNNLQARADVYEYDFDRDQWTARPSLPEARTQFGLGEYAESSWLFGGMNFDDTKRGEAMFSYPTSVLRRALGEQGPFVESNVTLPRPRRAFASGLLGDRFYVFGGMAGGFAPVTECEAFDFRSATWSMVACPSRVRIGAELVPMDGKLYLVAGRSRLDANGELQDDKRVEVYDPTTNTWSLLVESLPIEDTHQLRALPFGHHVLIYTAQRADEQLQLLLFDPRAR